MKNRRIAIAADHGGYKLKEAIKKHLEETGVEFLDLGADSDASCDYPTYAALGCREVTEGRCDMAILVCGTGIGMSIAANKVSGIRAACCTDTYCARMTRSHNDANVLCLGGRVIGDERAFDITDVFLGTEFTGGRHSRRIAMVSELEKEMKG